MPGETGTSLLLKFRPLQPFQPEELLTEYEGKSLSRKEAEARKSAAVEFNNVAIESNKTAVVFNDAAIVFNEAVKTAQKKLEVAQEAVTKRGIWGRVNIIASSLIEGGVYGITGYTVFFWNISLPLWALTLIGCVVGSTVVVLRVGTADTSRFTSADLYAEKTDEEERREEAVANRKAKTNDRRSVVALIALIFINVTFGLLGIASGTFGPFGNLNHFFIGQFAPYFSQSAAQVLGGLVSSIIIGVPIALAAGILQSVQQYRKREDEKKWKEYKKACKRLMFFRLIKNLIEKYPEKYANIEFVQFATQAADRNEFYQKVFPGYFIQDGPRKGRFDYAKFNRKVIGLEALGVRAELGPEAEFLSLVERRKRAGDLKQAEALMRPMKAPILGEFRLWKAGFLLVSVINSGIISAAMYAFFTYTLHTSLTLILGPAGPIVASLVIFGLTTLATYWGLTSTSGYSISRAEARVTKDYNIEIAPGKGGVDLPKEPSLFSKVFGPTVVPILLGLVVLLAAAITTWYVALGVALVGAAVLAGIQIYQSWRERQLANLHKASNEMKHKFLKRQPIEIEMEDLRRGRAPGRVSPSSSASSAQSADGSSTTILEAPIPLPSASTTTSSAATLQAPFYAGNTGNIQFDSSVSGVAAILQPHAPILAVPVVAPQAAAFSAGGVINTPAPEVAAILQPSAPILTVPVVAPQVTSGTGGIFKSPVPQPPTDEIELIWKHKEVFYSLFLFTFQQNAEKSKFSLEDLGFLQRISDSVRGCLQRMSNLGQIFIESRGENYDTFKDDKLHQWAAERPEEVTVMHSLLAERALEIKQLEESIKKITWEVIPVKKAVPPEETPFQAWRTKTPVPQGPDNNEPGRLSAEKKLGEISPEGNGGGGH